MSFEGEARGRVQFVGFLIGVGIDNGDVGGWGWGKNDGLKTSIVDDFVSGTVIWHQGRLLDRRDCMCSSEGSISCRFGVFEKTGVMMGGWVSELWIRFLDSKDVHVVGESKVDCTGIRESCLLIPGANADVRCK